MRKIITIILIAALLFSLCSCGKDQNKEKEYGKIDDVQISENVSGNKTKNNTLNKLPDEFGYTYRIFSVPRANMAFEVPDSWNVSIDNARHIVIENVDDKDFPDLRIHLFFRYDLTPPDSEHPEESCFQITDICSLFSSDRPKTLYPIDGEEYIISKDIVHKVENYNDQISYDSSMILLLRTDDIPLEEPVMGTMPKEKYSAIDYAVNLDGIPALFRTVCRTEDADKVQAILSYIVSSVSECITPFPSYLEQDLGEFSVKLPEEFIKTVSKEQNVFISPFRNAAGLYAGMGVGVFDSGTCEDENYSNVIKIFTENPADQSFIMPGESFGPCSINGIAFEDSRAFTVTILPGKEYAASFYRQNETCYFFSLKRGDKELIVWNCPNQEKQYENLYYNCLDASLCLH